MHRLIADMADFNILGWIVLVLLILISVGLIGTLLLVIIQKIINRVENNNTEPRETMILAKVTERIAADQTGEVMLTDSNKARQTYAAKLYRDGESALEKGTTVVIITFSHGIANVIPYIK